MKLTRKGKIVIALFIILVIGSTITIYVKSRLNQFNVNVQEKIGTKEDQKESVDKIKNKKPLSIAIFGVDTDEKRDEENIGQRTDSMLIASVNPKEETTKLLTLPRDTNVYINDIDRNEKIAHAYAYGGAKTAIDTIKNNFDIPIDGYITIDMDGFEEIIDIIDGIEVTSNASFSFNGSTFKEGKKTNLNGKQALDYVRSRKQEGAGGDEGRTARQRQVIEAVSQKVTKSKNVITLNKILKASEKNVKSNYSARDFKNLYESYKKGANHIDKLSLDGMNQIEDDGIWYFEPDDQSKKTIIEEYKTNLQIDT